MIPRSGGDYAYIGVAFGPLPAFLYLWVALLILVPTGNAITALTFAQYLLQPFWPTCEAPIEAVRLFAAIITCEYPNRDFTIKCTHVFELIFSKKTHTHNFFFQWKMLLSKHKFNVSGVLTVINCYNVKWVTRVTDTFTATKISALMLIVAFGAWHLFEGNTHYFEDPMKGSKTQPGFIALAFYSGLFSYSGWNYLNFVTEELKDPYK